MGHSNSMHPQEREIQLCHVERSERETNCRRPNCGSSPHEVEGGFGTIITVQRGRGAEVRIVSVILYRTQPHDQISGRNRTMARGMGTMIVVLVGDHFTELKAFEEHLKHEQKNGKKSPSPC